MFRKNTRSLADFAYLCGVMDKESIIEAPLSVDRALELNETLTLNELCDLADATRRHHLGNRVHTCSIVNARSGRCPEDCHWCAQSVHYHTGCSEYSVVNPDELNRVYDSSAARGVQRISLVTSGRRVTAAEMPKFTAMFRDLRRRGAMKLCASMGLLGEEELRMLKEAGVERYHCNLEAAESVFPALCTTHTRQNKLETIAAARRVGLEVCVGGIIGMGETLAQRLELARECRETGARSIPLNILCPIPGTPLALQPPLSEEEVVRTVALMRLVAPDCHIFFAGGRARLSIESVSRMLRGGADGAMVGNLLTTVGNDVDADFALFRSLDYAE